MDLLSLSLSEENLLSLDPADSLQAIQENPQKPGITDDQAPSSGPVM